MYKCWICEKEFTEYDGLRRHCGRIHKIHSSEVHVALNLNGVWPICACGCEKELNWTNLGFKKYIRGHQSRIINNWGHNETAKIKSKITQKKMYNSGELIVWNKGLTIEDPRVYKYVKNVNKKIKGVNLSKALKGKKKSPHVMEALANASRKYWIQPENRKKQSEARYNYFSTTSRNSQNGLELKFIEILTTLNINFIPQHQISNSTTKKRYDFYLPEVNTLIEVDGDYYHCNPKLYPDGPKYSIQLENIENDAIKNKLARDNGYNILRFWEMDINENKDQVIDTILKITNENGRG